MPLSCRVQAIAGAETPAKVRTRLRALRHPRLSYVATHRSAACKVFSHRRATGCPRSIRVASHSCSHVARYSWLPSSLLTHPICDPLPRAPSSNNQSVVASTLSCRHRSSLTPLNPNTKKRASISSLSCVAWSIFLSFLVWVWVRLRYAPPRRLGYNPQSGLGRKVVDNEKFHQSVVPHRIGADFQIEQVLQLRSSPTTVVVTRCTGKIAVNPTQLALPRCVSVVRNFN